MRPKIGSGTFEKSPSPIRNARKKVAPTNPESSPSNRNHGSWDKRVNSNEGASNQCPVPKNVRDSTEATTDDTSNGAKRFMEKLPRTICAAKTAPAIGALHPAAMPAAAPQATINRRRYGGQLASWPNLDAKVEDNWMSRPSRPIDAPVQRLIKDDAAFINAGRSRKRPSPATMASKRLVKPGLLINRRPRKRTNPAAIAPSVGTSNRCHHPNIPAISPRSPVSLSTSNLASWLMR